MKQNKTNRHLTLTINKDQQLLRHTSRERLAVQCIKEWVDPSLEILDQTALLRLQ